MTKIEVGNNLSEVCLRFDDIKISCKGAITNTSELNSVQVDMDPETAKQLAQKLMIHATYLIKEKSNLVVAEQERQLAAVKTNLLLINF